MKNICYNCSHCKDIEVDVYYCSHDENEDSNHINIINSNNKMCDVGLKELTERFDD